MKKYFLYIFFVSNLFSNVNGNLISNESYITGEDGVIRMYINIIGHVKSPGTYLVYDGIDIMSTLSIAGGYIDGADLKNIYIYNKNGETKKINLINLLNSGNSFKDVIDLNPYDTIYIDQKPISKMFVSSNLPSLILSFINLIITLENIE